MAARYGQCFVISIVAASCGGAASGTWSPAMQGKAERDVDHWTPADEEKYTDLACRNVIGPDGEPRCASLRKVGLVKTTCMASLAAWRRESTTDDKRFAIRLLLAGLSSADSCAQIDATFQIIAMSLARERASEKTANGCRQRPDGSLDLTGEEVLERRGLGDRLFSETSTTAETPIEVCGPLGEIKWLTRVTCDDGSRPWGKDIDAAHAARTGSTGGTRCGSPVMTIDAYVAPCPEKQYTVYMDMYHCGPGEELWRGVRQP